MKPLADRLCCIVSRGVRLLTDHPVLYRGGRVTLVAFGLFAAADSMAVVLVCCCALHAKGLALCPVVPFLPLGLVMVWTGAKVFHWIALGPKFAAAPSKYLLETGFYVHGGVIGGLGWVYLVHAVAGIPFLLLADGLAWGAMLGQVFGRLGCLNYGCCFGRATSGRVGVRYTNSESKILRWRPELEGVRVHATQLYMAATSLLLFAAACALFRRGVANGTLMCLFLVGDGMSRLLIERFRLDIHFREGRNWTTFRASILMVLCGVFARFAGQYLLPGLFNYTPSTRPCTLSVVPDVFRTCPASWPAIGSVGVLAFLGYGIHGRKLGTFPAFQNSAAST